MEFLTQTPVIPFLNTVVEETNILNNDVKTILFEYFVKCHNCQNYLNEEDVKKCACNTWCTYCFTMYVGSEKCNSCINDSSVTEDDYESNTCIEKDCENTACYGDLKYSLYCSTHAIDKVLVYYRYTCSRKINLRQCINIGLYVDDKYNSVCKEHLLSDVKYKLLLAEGYTYVPISNKKCSVCNISRDILYSCTCGKEYCDNCFAATVYRIKNTEKTFLHCAYCTPKHKIKGISTSINMTFCRSYKCNKDAYNYCGKDGYFYCNIHKNKYCVESTESCKYDNCRAWPVKLGGHCKYHAEQLKKFNIS